MAKETQSSKCCGRCGRNAIVYTAKGWHCSSCQPRSNPTCKES